MTIRLDQDRSAPSPHGVARGWVVRGCAVAIGLAGKKEEKKEGLTAIKRDKNTKTKKL